MRSIFAVITALAFGTCLPCVFAGQMGYTDTIGENKITYTFDYHLLAGNTYEAAFTISNSVNAVPESYAAWVTFKLSDKPIVSLAPGVGGFNDGWSLVQPGSNVQVLWASGKKYQTLPQSTFAGFYLDAIAKNPLPADPMANAVHLTGTPGTTTFNFRFTLQDGQQLNESSIPFKVGYYTPKGTTYQLNQLSKELKPTHYVPEYPFILMALPGLLGVIPFWKKLKKRQQAAK